MGRDLFPALLALAQWGDKYLTGAAGPPLDWRHADCGEPVTVSARCAAGHDVPVNQLSAVIPRRSSG
jgi:hypothetical protein